MPKLVTPTYILAFGYCAADALTTGHRKWEEGEDEKVMTSPDPTKNGNSREMKAVVATFDTLLWQSELVYFSESSVLLFLAFSMNACTI